MSAVPRHLRPVDTEAAPGVSTRARPVHDLGEVLRLGRLTFAEAEAGYEALYAAEPLQYQARDWRTHHYDLTRIAGLSYPVRGPVPETLSRGGYFVVLGGGASFGARADRPFGARVAAATGLPCLNLARAGCHADWLARSLAGELAPLVAGAAFAILEMPSALLPPHALPLDPDLLAGLQAAHGEELRDAIDLLPCPALLLWFSRRSPEPAEGPEAEEVLRLVPPRFVDGRAFEPIGTAAEIVECTGSEGLPSPAINRFTGAPDLFRQGGPEGRAVARQSHYQSDAMHRAAAAALLGTATIAPFLPR